MSQRSPFEAPPSSDILGGFIQDSPTPWHAVETVAERLRAARFAPLEPTQPWEDAPAGGYVEREGSLIAWRWPSGMDAQGMRIIAAHTDSPGLRLRPRPDSGAAGYRQLAVEVYGGALLNSWLDRDLTLAGRVVVADRHAPGGLDVKLFQHSKPLLRVPQLAIHLDRDVNEAGLRLDRQRHLNPVWGLGEPSEGELRSWLASEVGVRASAVMGYDVACVDAQRPGVLGRRGELFTGGRLDNLVSCFGGAEVMARMGPTDWPCILVLFDHEEVGSTSTTGALGAWFAQVLGRLASVRGIDATALAAALPSASMLSADMAHATHPNFPERHDPGHWIRLDGGPVIKHNVNQRYATSGIGAARFKLACYAAEIEVQEYSHRGDLPCGSTIGPLAAAGVAVDTVDVGMPMLSMHSCRELMATSSVESMTTAFEAWMSIDPSSVPPPAEPDAAPGQMVVTPRRRNRPMEHPPR